MYTIAKIALCALSVIAVSGKAKHHTHNNLHTKAHSWRMQQLHRHRFKHMRSHNPMLHNFKDGHYKGTHWKHHDRHPRGPNHAIKSASALVNGAAALAVSTYMLF